MMKLWVSLTGPFCGDGSHGCSGAQCRGPAETFKHLKVFVAQDPSTLDLQSRSGADKSRAPRLLDYKTLFSNITLRKEPGKNPPKRHPNLNTLNGFSGLGFRDPSALSPEPYSRYWLCLEAVGVELGSFELCHGGLGAAPKAFCVLG